MRIELLDGAGKRTTDGSTIALALSVALPPIISMLPSGRTPTPQEWSLVVVALVGLVFKFIRVVT